MSVSLFHSARRPRSAVFAAALGVATVTAAAACATATPFDRYLAEQRWTDAAQAFSADSSLLRSEQELYRGAILYGSPDRPTYDPALARRLFQRLVTQYPTGPHAEDARTRLALLDQVLHANDQVRDLEIKIAVLTEESRQLRTQLDSARSQGDLLRQTATKLEGDIRDRDDQLRALRNELQRLKEIDLKPPGKPIKP